MKSFVKDLTNFFTISPEQTRVSVMSFSSDVYLHIPFSRRFADQSSLDSAVDNIRYSGGLTATAMALNSAYNKMFTQRYGARGTGKFEILNYDSDKAIKTIRKTCKSSLYPCIIVQRYSI